MSGKRILLTGASSGMGRLIARTLAEQGHRVFAGMRDLGGRNAPRAAELEALDLPQPIVAVDLDVTDDASVDRCAAAVRTAAGGIDVLINCAGISWLGTTEAFSTRQFETILQTNVMGPFRLYKAALPDMRAAGEGLLITISSVCGRLVLPNFGIYCASKFALEALTEALAYETADLGIETVIVEPAFFDTGLLAAQQDPEGGGVAAAYGAMARFSADLSAAMQASMVERRGDYDPQIVADAVGDIVAMPKGRRPLRVPVGQVGVLPDLNRQIGGSQGAFLRRVGLSHLSGPPQEHGHA